MSMERKDVDDHVEEAVSCPVLARRLQHVVEDIEDNVPGDKTKQMMYELVDIVLQMGQRVRELEMKMAGFNVSEELARKQAYPPRRKINYARDFPAENEHARHR